MDPGLLTVLGFGSVVLGVAAYATLLFVLRRFTYRTGLLYGVIYSGVALSIIGWLAGGSGGLALAAGVVGVVAALLIRRELSITGSRELRVRPGATLPAFKAVTTEGQPVTERDLAANAPSLLVLYRGWWCPSTRVQLQEISAHYEQLAEMGLTVYAASVDGPAEAAPLQDEVGRSITILCSVPEEFLDATGVRDQRGAPWYDQLLFHAPRRSIAMPAALVIDRAGRLTYAHRSTRVDDRPRPAEIAAFLRPRAS